MRINFRHSLKLLFHIMPQNYVLKTKVKSWSYRKMTDDESIGLPSVLVKHNKVCHSFSQPQFDKFRENGATSIDSGCIGQKNAKFFSKLKQTICWIPASGEQELRIRVDGICILIVDPRAGNYIINKVLMLLESCFLRSS